MLPHDLNQRERRFVGAALRRGVTRSATVKTLALGTSAAVAITLVVSVERPSATSLWLSLASGALLLVILTLSIHRARRAGLPDALRAIDRCGDCGHSMRGGSEHGTDQLHIKACAECGSRWSDVDRFSSIAAVYWTGT